MSVRHGTRLGEFSATLDVGSALISPTSVRIVCKVLQKNISPELMHMSAEPARKQSPVWRKGLLTVGFELPACLEMKSCYSNGIFVIKLSIQQ